MTLEDFTSEFERTGLVDSGITPERLEDRDGEPWIVFEGKDGELHLRAEEALQVLRGMPRCQGDTDPVCVALWRFVGETMQDAEGMADADVYQVLTEHGWRMGL